MLRGLLETRATKYFLRLVLDEKTFNLLLGDKTVGIVYFRTGYLPEDYVSENAWNARLLMERSTAIV